MSSQPPVVIVKALHDYAAAAPNQISFKRGDYISVVQMGASGSWSRGEEKLTGKIGFFPSDYVETVTTILASSICPIAAVAASDGGVGATDSKRLSSSSSSIMSKITAKVLYNFAGTGHNEMPLRVDEIIEVTKQGPPGGWCKGISGAFPTDYVQFLPFSSAGIEQQQSPVIDLLTGDVSALSATKKADSMSIDFFGASAEQAASGSIYPNEPVVPMHNTTTAASSIYIDNNSNALTAASGRNSITNAIDPFNDISSITTTNSTNVSSSVTTTIMKQSSGAASTISDVFAVPDTMFTSAGANATHIVNDVSSVTTNLNISANTSISTSSMGNYSNIALQQPASLPSPPPPVSIPQTIYARVLYSRQSQGPTELTIQVGDTLIVLKQDSEWWYGAALSSGGQKVGFFPGNYVEIVKDVSESIPPPPLSAPSYKPAEVVVAASSSISTITTNYPATAAAAVGMITSALRLPKKEVLRTSVSSLMNGSTFTYKPPYVPADYVSKPVWFQTFFLDLYADEYKASFVPKDPQASTSAIKRMHNALYAVRVSLTQVKPDDQQTEGMKEVLLHTTRVFTEACDFCSKVPEKTGDVAKFWSYLASFVVRVKALSESESVVIPCHWMCEDNTEHAVLCVITKFRRGTDSDYSFAVINTGDGKKGLDYHAASMSNADGKLLRNISFQLVNIPNEKITNAAFWLLMLRSTISPNPKYGCTFFYERLLPFLVSMPILSALQYSIATQLCFNDFRPLPVSGDISFINCALECARMIGRLCGLNEAQANHLTMLARWGMLENVRADIGLVNTLTSAEIDILRQSTHCVNKAVAVQSQTHLTVSSKQLDDFKRMSEYIEERLNNLDIRRTILPTYALVDDIKLPDICDFNMFGRFRKDIDIEFLAGEAPVPPIYRPIELTLVPDTVSDFMSVACAMRHCLNLCVLLSNQKNLVRNSYTIRVCLIEHLFVRVIPLPLPITHPMRRKQCFWNAQSIRYETQADILRLLNMLCRHFACASLSIKATRSGDAIRMLTFACMATICDATLRKVAIDISSQSGLHYSGAALGPIQPFGFDMGSFAEESEFLKFPTPETTSARTQVLDYFNELKKVIDDEYMLFCFEKGNQCRDPEKKYIDQLCVQVGFQRGNELKYITGEDLYVQYLYFNILDNSNTNMCINVFIR